MSNDCVEQRMEEELKRIFFGAFEGHRRKKT